MTWFGKIRTVLFETSKEKPFPVVFTDKISTMRFVGGAWMSQSLGHLEWYFHHSPMLYYRLEKRLDYSGFLSKNGIHFVFFPYNNRRISYFFTTTRPRRVCMVREKERKERDERDILFSFFLLTLLLFSRSLYLYAPFYRFYRHE